MPRSSSSTIGADPGRRHRWETPAPRRRRAAPRAGCSRTCAILASAYDGGAGQPVADLVRLVEDPSGAYADLQVDPDGSANGADWLTIAFLDGSHLGETAPIILDGALPAVTIHDQADPGLMADFNGDGNADIVWQNDSGGVTLWEMSGHAIAASPSLGSLDAATHIVGIGDFGGGAGMQDILLRNDTGAVGFWKIVNGQVVANQSIGTLDETWQAAGVADFDGNGTSDILWQNANGQVMLWEMSGHTVTASPVLGTLAAGTQIVGIGDFGGGAGVEDVLLRDGAGDVSF